jgi:UPF0716 family protein affecting phage T7 exclusion
MHPIKTIAVALLAWPAAEIVAFFCVAAAIGFVNALLLIVLMSVAGFLVLRHFSGGTGKIEMAGGGFIAASTWNGPGLAPGLGGILTGALGIAVLFPVSRRWLLGSLRMFATRTRPSHDDVIDLAPDEWRPLPGTTLPPGDHTDGTPKQKK